MTTMRSTFAAALALACAAGAAQADPQPRAHFAALALDGHIDVPSAMLDLGFDIGGDGRRAGCTPALYAYTDALPRRADGNYCTHFDLARARAGGLDAAFLSIWISTGYVGKTAAQGGGPARRAFDMIAAVKAQVARHPGRVVLATGAADVRRAAADGRFAALLGIEGGHAIEDSLALLRAFHREGVRYLTLTHTRHTDWADSSGGLMGPIAAEHGGLTDFGRDVVREMNRLGMLVDVSHVADATLADVLEVATKPVIASHSSVRAIAPHHRNLTDEQLRAIAQNGGVVMVNFHGDFIDPAFTATIPRRAQRAAELGAKFGADDPRIDWLVDEETRRSLPRTPLAVLADHVEHVARVAGHDHVGLGSDFDGAPFMPADMDGVEDLPNLSRLLLERGWSDANLAKLLGGNALRVLEASAP
jgi:membrane dipeptidase